jgi:hypothetical protein
MSAHAHDLHRGREPRVCPRCGQTLPERRLGIPLSALKARIFDLVQRAGADGIDGRDLFDLAYAGREKIPQRDSLKAHIIQINDAIEETGWRIRGCPYRLIAPANPYAAA